MMSTVHIVTCSASSIEGINNFGDELLTAMYRRWLEEAHPAVAVSHLSVSPYGSLRAPSARDLVRARGLVFTGGGYFADGYGQSRLYLKRQLRSMRNHRVYWPVAKAAAGSGIPHGVLGLEIGPLVNPIYRRAVRTVLRTAREVVARNAESAEYAARLTGDPSRIAMHLDAALAIDALLQGPLDRLPGVNIGCHVHELGSGGLPELVALIGRVLAGVPDAVSTRLFYLHDQRKQGEHAELSTSAERMLLNHFPETEVIEYHEPMDTVARIAKMDAVITSKLHVGIVARAFGIPVLAVGTHPKIARFYSALGEEEFCGTARSFLTRGLPPRLLECISGPPGSRTAVDERLKASALENQRVAHRLAKSMVAGV